MSNALLRDHVIRAMTPGDVAQVVGLAETYFDQTELSDITEFNKDRATLHVTFTMGAGQNIAIVADKDSTIIGFALAYCGEFPFSDDKLVQNVTYYVASDHRGQGVAGDMLRALEERAAAQGIKMVGILSATNVDREEALAFLSSRGYTDAGLSVYKVI